MTTTTTISVSVLLSIAAATGISFGLRSSQEPAPTSPIVDALRREVAELLAAHDALNQQLARAAAAVPASAPVAERTAANAVSPEAVAAAVEAYLSQRGGALPAGAGTGSATDVPFDVDRAFLELAGTDYWSNPDAWKRAFASGRIDALIAKFEAAAKANPTDTKVQMQLATAYLAHLQLDQSKWQLSMKADKVFDTVLELEPQHWEARFTKAVSYTFWPDFLGKKKDAITHFETLVQQQESMPVEAEQAQTYLFLGNLIEARDPAKAREVWARGARRHPDNQELAKKKGP